MNVLNPISTSDVLWCLSETLELSKDMHDKARNEYASISKHLLETLSRDGLESDVFVQGSFMLGTVIRPMTHLSSDENAYDIDLVCLINEADRIENPKHLKGIVGGALCENPDYKKRIKEKNRCWTLESREFHVDVLPAVPEDDADNLYGGLDRRYAVGPIKIPDKELGEYRSSNPRGYAAWFQVQNTRLGESEIPNGRFPQFYSEKTTLERVVQLLKRHRDIMFTDDPDNKPVSIIITTLVAEHYEKEEDIFQAMDNVISRMPDRIASDNIPNPVNPKENFADKWCDHPERKEAFNEWLASLNAMMRDLKEIEDVKKGLPAVQNVLQDHYGKKITEQAWKRLTEKVNNARKPERLSVSKAGVIGVSSAPIGSHSAQGQVRIRENKFYGD